MTVAEQEETEPTTEPEPATPEPEQEPSEEEAEEQAEEERREEQPPPPSGPSEEQLESRAREGEKSWNRQKPRIATLYGDDFQHLLECPLCPDFHKGFVDARFAGLVPDEIVRSIQMYLGIQREREYKQGTAYRRCDACEGYGKVQTGSNVPGRETVQCPTCHGLGYEGPPVQAPAAHDGMTAPVLAAVPEGPPEDQADRDNWGEPRILPDGRENPNYGKWPQFKIPVEPWGQTAGLTAQNAVG